MPLPLQQVGAIDAGRDGADEHLPGARPRDRFVGDAEDLGSAGRCNVDAAHGLRKSVHGVFISLAAGRTRSEKGLKSVLVSKASTPSRRLSQATTL